MIASSPQTTVTTQSPGAGLARDRRRHSDGELAFGGGWFIVVATLPTGQISNHYQAEHWEQFQVPEVDLPPEYDGHTPAEALDRLVRFVGPDSYTRTRGGAA